LILTRRPGEELWIDLEDGRRIVVAVDEVRGKAVRLGVEAPRTVGVNRREVVEASARRDRKDGE
jgi:carbon storage regulator